MSQLKMNGWEKETHNADEINEDEIQKVFMIVDRDSSGFLSKKEAKRACKLIGEKFGIDEVNIYPHTHTKVGLNGLLVLVAD